MKLCIKLVNLKYHQEIHIVNKERLELELD
jgi:hypothetical protein